MFALIDIFPIVGVNADGDFTHISKCEDSVYGK